jgi:hypothetical protein
MADENPFTQAERDRLHAAIKGRSRFANAQVRTKRSQVTRIELAGVNLRSVAQISSCISGSGVVSITSSTGLYAMLGVVGAGQGSTIK